MKALIGTLLIISGAILAIPALYDVLSYLEYEHWPVVQGILGISCIVVGIFFQFRGGGGIGKKRVLTEVG